jgi:hypothetical protein
MPTSSYEPKLNPNVCGPFQQANSHQFPYHVFTSVSTSPLEQVFFNVWGLAVSTGKQKYYVRFIDD